MNAIYLDNNATTPVHRAVVAAMEPFWSAEFANASSPHASGRRARKAVEDARECVGELLGAHPDEVVFTCGGTEANNLAIRGLAGESPAHALTSPIEHPCVAECFALLERRGWDVERLAVDGEGLIDPADLKHRLKPQTRLASVMLANNDTGVIEPIETLGKLAADHGFLLHTDAVQAVAKMPVRFHELGVTSLALSAHKLHGPKGIGALLVRRGAALQPLLQGGHQQGSLRPGTEPVALLVGFAEALRIAYADFTTRLNHLTLLRDRLEKGVRALLPDVMRNGPARPCLPNTLNLTFPGLESEELLVHLDLEGVACSAGSACASGSTEPSPTLVAMGCDELTQRSSLRFSVGDQNTAAEIDQAVERITRIVNRLRGVGSLAV